MAKNRNKKKKNGVASMDTAETTSVPDVSQAMDTSESVAPVVSASNKALRKIKGRPMKRSMTSRKKKSIAKAISLKEKRVEKVVKTANKSARTQSAKILYE